MPHLIRVENGDVFEVWKAQEQTWLARYLAMRSAFVKGGHWFQCQGCEETWVSAKISHYNEKLWTIEAHTTKPLYMKFPGGTDKLCQSCVSAVTRLR